MKWFRNRKFLLIMCFISALGVYIYDKNESETPIVIHKQRYEPGPEGSKILIHGKNFLKDYETYKNSGHFADNYDVLTETIKLTLVQPTPEGNLPIYDWLKSIDMDTSVVHANTKMGMTEITMELRLVDLLYCIKEHKDDMEKFKLNKETDGASVMFTLTWACAHQIYFEKLSNEYYTKTKNLVNRVNAFRKLQNLPPLQDFPHYKLKSEEIDTVLQKEKQARHK